MGKNVKKGGKVKTKMTNSPMYDCCWYEAAYYDPCCGEVCCCC